MTTDPLQQIIDALDPTEKRYFKVFAAAFKDNSSLIALFDRLDNDLVVDSASMYAGVAPRAEAQAIFVRGAEVNHFRYFRAHNNTIHERR
jgi:hypothetical protein